MIFVEIKRKFEKDILLKVDNCRFGSSNIEKVNKNTYNNEL